MFNSNKTTAFQLTSLIALSFLVTITLFTLWYQAQGIYKLKSESRPYDNFTDTESTTRGPYTTSSITNAAPSDSTLTSPNSISNSDSKPTDLFPKNFTTLPNSSPITLSSISTFSDLNTTTVSNSASDISITVDTISTSGMFTTTSENTLSTNSSSNFSTSTDGSYLSSSNTNSIPSDSTLASTNANTVSSLPSSISTDSSVITFDSISLSPDLNITNVVLNLTTEYSADVTTIPLNLNKTTPATKLPSENSTTAVSISTFLNLTLISLDLVVDSSTAETTTTSNAISNLTIENSAVLTTIPLNLNTTTPAPNLPSENSTTAVSNLTSQNVTLVALDLLVNSLSDMTTRSIDYSTTSSDSNPITPDHNSTSSYYNNLLISRSNWKALPATSFTQLILPVSLIIIQRTNRDPCFRNCVKEIQTVQEIHMKRFQYHDLAYNFLVGGDGKIYEGRGWDRISEGTARYNNKSLEVGFSGTFGFVDPPDKQIHAFYTLMEKGVEFGYLSPDYKIIAARQVFSGTLSPGQCFFEVIKTWQRWLPTP